MNSKHSFRYAWLFIAALLQSCDSSDPNTAQGTPAEDYIRANISQGVIATALTYNIAVLSKDDWPVQGTVVIAYQNGNYVTHSKTNSRGVASLTLPEGSENKADIHILYWQNNNFANLLSLVDLAPGQRIIRTPPRGLLSQSGLGLYDSAATDTCNSITLDWLRTDNTQTSAFLWSEYSLPLINPEISSGSAFQICNQQRQRDGRVTFLGMNYGYFQSPWMYGFLLDQRVQSGDHFAITLDRQASTITWQTEQGQAPSYLILEGSRKGRLVRVAEHLGPRGLGPQGTMVVADQFPVDHYIMQYGLTANGSHTRVTELLDHINNNITLSIPATPIETITLEKDSASQSITARWKLAESADVDYVSLHTQLNSSGKLQRWDILLPPSRTDWAYPTLLGVGIINTSLIAEPTGAMLSVTAYPDVDNYDEYLERLTQLDQSNLFAYDRMFGDSSDFRFDFNIGPNIVVEQPATVTVIEPE